MKALEKPDNLRIALEALRVLEHTVDSTEPEWNLWIHTRGQIMESVMGTK